jgi:hypothetical protein
MVRTLVNIVEMFCCSSTWCSRLDCRCCGRGAPELPPSDSTGPGRSSPEPTTAANGDGRAYGRFIGGTL